jgi:hypothetical protein
MNSEKMANNFKRKICHGQGMFIRKLKYRARLLHFPFLYCIFIYFNLLKPSGNFTYHQV